MSDSDFGSEATTIENRSDFIRWAIERSHTIVIEQGGDLALAARDTCDDKIAETANALGQAIVDALLEVFDGFVSGSGHRSNSR
ncbi:MAG: hypothetical protein KDJ29_19215 [Hyphomicrobiales bacterium]|nr:hypothetical protein [Hyphomicrobiales bacterium]